VDVSVEIPNTNNDETPKWLLQLSAEIPVKIPGPGEVLTSYIEPDEIPENYRDAFMMMKALAWENPQNKDETILTLTLPPPQGEGTAGMFRFEASVDIPDAQLIHGGDMNFAFDFGNGWLNLFSVNTKTFLIDTAFDRSTINVVLEPIMLDTETTAIFGKRIRITNLPIYWLNETLSPNDSDYATPIVTSELIGEDTSRKLFGPSPTTSMDDNALEEAMALWLNPRIHLRTISGKPSVLLTYGSDGPPPAPARLRVTADIDGKNTPPLMLRVPFQDLDQQDHRKTIKLITPETLEIDQEIAVEFLGLPSAQRRDELSDTPTFGGRIQMDVPVKIDDKESTP